MSDILNIQSLRDRLDNIELDSIFEQEIAATGIFENWEDLAEAPTPRQLARRSKQFTGPREPGGSPLINAFGKDIAGVKLAKYLHDNYQVSDRAQLQPFEHPSGNLDLMTFKTHYDNFTILKGPGGWAAIKPKTAYLRPKLEKEPGYNPSTDRNQVYIGVFSLYDGSDVFVKEITGSRGGAYSKREKKEVTTPTIADQLKDAGIGDKGIKVYRLMDRDAPSTADIPPEQMSGRRSKDIGGRGASVQRAKVDARTAYKASMNPDTEALLGRLSDRLFKISSNVVAAIPRRLRKAGLDPDTNRKLQAVENNPNEPAFLEAWKNAVNNGISSAAISQDPAVQALIQTYRSQNPQNNESDGNIVIRMASQGKPEVLQPLVKSIRNELESWFKA
jgi:hypothetical protein